MADSKATDKDDPIGALHKRRITLEDGRYLIFFTFGAEAADATAQAAAQPEPAAAPVAEEERRV
jgi:hypothetical protein